MAKNYMIFKGIQTDTDLDILIEELNIVPKAKRQQQQVNVLGRSGFLNIDYREYEPIQYDVTIKIYDVDKIDKIKETFDGSGIIELSTHPNRFWYATVINQIDFTRILFKYHECTISFMLQPFSYQKNVQTQTITQQTTIVNTTNTKSKPTMKVYFTTGTNKNGNVYINGNTISFSGCSEYVELDFDLEECWKGSTNMMNKMTGEFWELEVGNNTISFDGDVLKIEINPRWRYL